MEPMMMRIIQRAGRRKLLRYGGSLGLWIAAGWLLWYTFRQVSLRDVGSILRTLQWWHYVHILIATLAASLLKFVRWWMILRAQKQSVPFGQVAVIRQAAFAISTVTPGPQFGGEPLQVWALTHHYQMRAGQAIASVTLDRMAELSVSFAFIIAGSILLLQQQLGFSLQTVTVASLILITPPVYLLALRLNRRPLAYLTRPFPQLHTLANASESVMSDFLQQGERRLEMLLLISIVGFFAQIWEYGAMLMAIGVPIQWMSFITLFTTARLTLFVPTPAGLGAVESGQLFAFAAIGLQAAMAVSLTLLIRLRDLLLILIGLFFASRLLQRR